MSNIIKKIKCHQLGLHFFLILYQNCRMGRLDKDDIILNQKIALRLRKLREEIEPIQAKFAKKNHIDRQILSRWENSNNKRGVSIHTIQRFCKLINISLTDFFDDELFR